MDEPERPGPDRWRWRRRRWPRWDLRWWLIRKSTANGFSIIRFQLAVWWPGRTLTRRGHLTFFSFRNTPRNPRFFRFFQLGCNAGNNHPYEKVFTGQVRPVNQNPIFRRYENDHETNQLGPQVPQ